MIRFLYRALRGRRLLVCLAVALTFTAVASDVLAAFPFKIILDKIVNHRDPRIPGTGWLLDGFDRFGDRSGLNPMESHTQLGVLLFAGLVFLALGLISAVVAFVQLSVAAFVGQDLGARLRKQLFTHIEHLGLDWHVRQQVGEVVQRVSGNITDIEKLVTDGLVDLLSGVLTLAGILTVMLVINWQFTVLAMCIAPLLFVTVLLYTRWVKRASKEAARAAGQVARVANASITAIVELKAFTLERWAARAFAGHVDRQRRFGLRAGRRQAEFNPLVMVFITVSDVVIITLGAWIAAGHAHGYSLGFLTVPATSLTIGTLTVFLAYSKQLYQPMRDLSKLTLLASTASAAAARIEEILDQPPEERSAAPRYIGPSRLRGEVAYRGVVFGYEPDRPVLHGVDLEIRPGTRLALVGLSGSGKTTLTRLLPRFYESWQGTITVDGVDVRDYPLPVLRDNIAVVPEDAILFEGTVHDNIAIGRPGATDGQVIAAAQQAHIHDTITALPGGYQAEVRELGKNLSRGQRQRIAIARALLRDAPILILDEPTSNLDVEAEAEVMRALEHLTRGRTVIVISHRLSTLGQVDEIVVLQAGRIAERGTYQQLRACGGPFARLLAEQNRYAAEPPPLTPVDDTVG
ncbi:ABC transporter ATP-binding protein [Streptantibioticus rubrisoli]|uniref:ABC transporter ATP-binding protein/permease n=1 Tax=Streptantibioticus rubrisoli TaxID=1387313 RepID=A0ABT1PAY9_9ACTN|nr:ABC transporter ATP-binding protein [Streptantibioticus rubrisoli]MCQ4042539.1 ABC transporter ATP-binding protein/permease [Streptantibioticus rubrisoli]